MLIYLFQMLENLVIAVESEAQVVDIGRVSGFMQKVCGLLFVVCCSGIQSFIMKMALQNCKI